MIHDPIESSYICLSSWPRARSECQSDSIALYAFVSQFILVNSCNLHKVSQ